jgi:hypothetical protein
MNVPPITEQTTHKKSMIRRITVLSLQRKITVHTVMFQKIADVILPEKSCAKSACTQRDKKTYVKAVL